MLCLRIVQRTSCAGFDFLLKCRTAFEQDGDLWRMWPGATFRQQNCSIMRINERRTHLGPRDQNRFERSTCRMQRPMSTTPGQPLRLHGDGLRLTRPYGLRSPGSTNSAVIRQRFKLLIVILVRGFTFQGSSSSAD